MVQTPFPLFIYLILFLGCAGSSLLHGVLSSCGQRGLSSSCRVSALRCGGLSLQSAASEACGLSSRGS